MQCPHCQQNHPDASRFCPVTGAPLEWAMPVCPSCGREVHPGARFCAACGKALPREIHRPQPGATRANALQPNAGQEGVAQAGVAPIEAPQPDAPPSAEQDVPKEIEAGASAAPTRPSALVLQPNADKATSGKAQPPSTNPGRAEAHQPVGSAPALAWTAVPTGPHSQAARERRAQQKQWLAYVLGAVTVTAALVGLLVWRQFSADMRQPASALLLASATAAAGGELQPSPTLPVAGLQQSPSPAPPTIPPTVEPSPLPTRVTPAITVAAQPSPGAPAVITPAAPSYRLAFFSNRDNLSAIYLMDPDHPQSWLAVPLPENYELVSWPSFCRGQLAFEARDRSFTLPTWIFLYDLENAEVAPLAIDGEPPQRLIHPGCSPSGRWMVLGSFRAGDWSLGLLDFEASRIVAERSTGDYSNLGFAAWPQAEDRFFWMGMRPNGYFDINETPIIKDGEFGAVRLEAQGKYPAVSPDGKRMVSFCGNLLYLCMMERDTNTVLFQIPVSYFKKIDRKEVPASAAWSSDGKWIYFSSSTSGSWDIYRMRPDGSMIQNLTEDWPSDELMPAAQ